MAALEKQVSFPHPPVALSASYTAHQLDGVVESMRLQRVIPLADPPLSSYSELVAAWGWIGRGSQVCFHRLCGTPSSLSFKVLQGAVDELHHCIVEAIDLRAKM
jgi:hypothetical protein